MADPDASLKITFGYNSAAYCPIKMKFGVRKQIHTHTKVSWSKCLITGGRQHFKNRYYVHIWAASRPNLTTFCTQTQILTQP